MADKHTINFTSKKFREDFIKWIDGADIKAIAVDYHSEKTLLQGFKKFEKTDLGKKEIRFNSFKKQFLCDEALLESVYSDYENNYSVSTIADKHGISGQKINLSRLMRNEDTERMRLADKNLKNNRAAGRKKAAKGMSKQRCVHWVFTKPWRLSC